MAHITALMLVLTLTGTPAAGVVCVAECHTAPATSGHCHEGTIDGATISTGVSCYDPSVAESLYVIESRAVTGPAILVDASVLPMAVAPVEAIGVVPPRADVWLKPPMVLRI